MKIVVTGSLGNISKPLTKELVQKGHSVTVISSKPERQKDIEALGAMAAIGSLEDVDFLTNSFTWADVVYCMTPLNFKDPDLIGWFTKISNNYARAIQKAGVKRVIVLSGWVAGIISAYKEIENILTESSGASVTQIRPGSFYSNFFDSIDMIKEKGMLASIYGGEDRIVFSAPADIADAIVDEIILPDHNNKVRYVASDEMTCNEAAKIIGIAIGKPDLKWVAIEDKEMLRGPEMAGLSPKLASDIIEMQAPIHKGLMTQEFSRHRPEVIIGKVKLKDFAKEFASVFNSK
ncbi:MAG TPA: NAD(P)H-binding protein [Hanamia sp.]|nr:NAD(P)H-binding protein [Hanamia sp.]